MPSPARPRLLERRLGSVKYEEYHPYGTTAWWAGDSTKKDVQLLLHELAEASAEQVFGLTYREAHEMANALFKSPL